MPQSIHERILACRRAAGLTQEQLGARLGVSGQAVSKWEKGESMPDILLLPQLCAIFGISTDTLLGVTYQQQAENTVHAFCDYACRTGRSAAILDMIFRLFNDGGVNHGGENIDFGPDHLRFSSGSQTPAREGIGAVLYGKAALTCCLEQPVSNIAYFLRPLADEGVLSVLRCIQLDTAVTQEELITATSLDEATLSRILLELMKRSIICCDTDRNGKQGYLQAANMAGVYLILAGCLASNCGGELRGNLWFTRTEKER